MQYVIRAGKVLLRGVDRAISRGVKRLRELGARLLSRSRFKGFRIRINGRWFILEGRINPWVVIVEGEIKSSTKGTKDAQFLTEKELEELRRGGTPHPDRLSEFDARRYHETTSQRLGKVGDGLTGDHIPSRAALVERFKLDNPGKPVPEDLINREGVTVVLKGTDHATLSRTYASRNTATQILEDYALEVNPTFFWYRCQCDNSEHIIVKHIDGGLEGIMTAMTSGPVPSPLPAASLLLEAFPRASIAVGSARPGAGEHQIGGFPVWIDEVFFPRVPGANRGMMFLGSIDLAVTPLGWKTGQLGIVYCFFDDESRIAVSLRQTP